MAGRGRAQSGWRRVGAVVLLMGGLLALVACGGDSSSGTGASQSAATGRPGLLKAPAGTSEQTLTAAADLVRNRLGRMGVTDAVVTVQDEGIDVRSSADAYQLHAAAQQHATTIVAITASDLGPCNGLGTASAAPPSRCYALGPALTGVGAITNAVVAESPGAGWKISFSVDPNQYQTFRTALDAAGSEPLAIVTDGVVALAFGSGIPALQSVVGPPLAEDQARLTAAALAVDSDLPIALEGPALPEPTGARVDLDFWTAALGVKICGSWLANAPSFGLDTGVHTHGDGLVYVHPFTADEAGDKATLGLFMQRGGWRASPDRLELWDGAEHRSGDTCPDGQRAKVRWWVDGVEQDGDPTRFRPRNGQVVVLTFDSDPTPPGAPPQMAALRVPPIGAATS